MCEDQRSGAMSVSRRKSPSPPCPVPRPSPGASRVPRPHPLAPQLPAPTLRSHRAAGRSCWEAAPERSLGACVLQRLEQNGFSNFKPQFVFK